ncbi:LysR family transcriptional regulator, partial [Salmonella enterica subsp. enterica serovar Poona]
HPPRPAAAPPTPDETGRAPLFVPNGLFGTRPGLKIPGAVGSTGTEACVM